MLKILLQKWDKNKNRLKQYLEEATDLNSCSYAVLVKATFEYIYNDDDNNINNIRLNKLDVENITEIDDGDWQGTLLFLIPFKTYQPSESEYLMTYIDYGSCSGCDTLQAIQDWSGDKLTSQQVTDFMTLCKDILCNTIKPYNRGWREENEFTHAEFNEKEISMAQSPQTEKESQKPIATINPPPMIRKKLPEGKLSEFSPSEWNKNFTSPSMCNDPKIVPALWAESFHAYDVMNIGERLDIRNDVYYNEETWQSEQELYKGLSEEERKKRRYEIGLRGKQIAFLDIRDQALEKGYTVRLEAKGFLLLEKEENGELHRIEVDNPAAISEFQQDYDIRVTYRNQRKEEVWYLKVKTEATTVFLDNKLCFSLNQLLFAQRVKGHYCIVIVLLYLMGDLNFCFFHEPPTLYLFQHLGSTEDLQIGNTEYFKRVQADISNLICDDAFDKLDMYNFFYYN